MKQLPKRQVFAMLNKLSRSHTRVESHDNNVQLHRLTQEMRLGLWHEEIDTNCFLLAFVDTMLYKKTHIYTININNGRSVLGHNIL